VTHVTEAAQTVRCTVTEDAATQMLAAALDDETSMTIRGHTARLFQAVAMPRTQPRTIVEKHVEHCERLEKARVDEPAESRCSR